MHVFYICKYVPLLGLYYVYEYMYVWCVMGVRVVGM